MISVHIKIWGGVRRDFMNFLFSENDFSSRLSSAITSGFCPKLIADPSRDASNETGGHGHLDPSNPHTIN